MKLEYISGIEGNSLYANDYRIAGPKPWGGGYAICQFDIDEVELLNRFADETAIFEMFQYSLFINGKHFYGPCTQEEYEKGIEEIEKRRTRFSKDDRHRHKWELCRRHKWAISKNEIILKNK